MDAAATALIRKGAEEKLPKDSIRRELISQGFSTSGFDEAYQTILAELHVKEPVPEVPRAVAVSFSPVGTVEAAELHLPSVVAVLKEGCIGVARRWKTLAIAGVIIGVWGFAYVSFLVLPQVRGSIPEGIFTTIAAVLPLLHLVISILVSGAVVYATTAAASSGFKEGFSWSFHSFFSILWIGLLALFVTIGGFIALVIPGLLLLFLNAFTLLAFVRERKKGMAALLRSYDLVRPHFLPVTLRLLALFAVTLFGYLLITFLANTSLFLPRGGILAYVITVFGEYLLLGFMLSALVPLYTSLAAAHPLFEYTKYRLMRTLYAIAAFIGLLAFCAYIAFSGLSYLASSQYQYQLPAESPLQLGTSTAPVSGEGSGFSFADLLTQSKVESTAASARIYGTNMGSYDGVCKDISVVDPVFCSASNDAYVIYAPLQAGGAYCTDSTGFSGTIDSAVSGSSCK
jgi:hypothetical protein